MSITEQTYYKPGLIFLSNSANLQVFVRDAKFHVNPYTLEREQIEPAIMVEFGGGSLSGSEWSDGEGHIHADIRGGAFDLDEEADRLEWGDDVKEMVAQKMLRLHADPSFHDFWLYEQVAPSKPWPTYDEASEGRIPQLASELDLLDEAITYERYTQKRPKVMAALQEKIDARVDDEALEEA